MEEIRRSALPPDSDDEAPYRQLTAEEAQRLRERFPPLPLSKVLAAQVMVGVLAALAAWGWTGKMQAGWSAAYGALAVALPAAIFARGLTSRWASLDAKRAAAAFMGWEAVKIAATFALLAAAPKLVPQLSWPALLVGLVLVLKVYWVALAFSGKRRDG
ncbi:MAG TPA: ATP synthase subunit I [Ramlibacter sp.]|jgi:ATP synthase protein I